ncbi:restriction endonuclease [uncultured Methanoregula sp.]|uniref:restriction endonuclease n=1 Tax=uncultured Methanoregula sp. TaxID=1005933 RepID=UPI002AABDD52|nr:restriction endonuclease [uncultured Methanoregula sp.]
MGKLKIFADGDTPNAQANARGHLFESLMADVLAHSGYKIENKPHVNYAGMEIDIEGRTLINDVKLYAECKCYDKEIDSPKFLAFFGKYMSMWVEDNHCQGLFIAIPGINSHVRGFYNTKCKENNKFNIRVLDENDVLKTIIEAKLTVSHDVITNSIDKITFEIGDWNIMYTDIGLFWVQYILRKGEGTPSSLALIDSKGNLINDPKTIEYLKKINSELSNFQIFSTREKKPEFSQSTQVIPDEQIVKVQGSSSCFEYQFPASPDFLVGRKKEKTEILSFFNQVINKEVSSRGLLFEGNSGWGKSSLALTTVELLKNSGNFGITIDSRTASSSQFVLKAVEYSLNSFGDFSGIVKKTTNPYKISGFDSGVSKLITIGHELEKQKKVMVIIFDQFENVFFIPDALNRIRDLFFQITDAQTNIILGFSWKTDLVGSINEFPYEIQNYIRNSSKPILLRPFNDQDTNELLTLLEGELKPKRKLTKDLIFFLSDFSQGFPWRLKKLCSHVKSQIENGSTQEEIATRLLNIEDLFQDDIEKLNPQELDALHRIAKVAPISFQELSSDDFDPAIVRNLVDLRLLVKIGPKYDIYMDNFRDYLNTGHLLFQENYLLRMTPGSIIKTIQILSPNSGKMLIPEFMKKANLKQYSYYNVARDIRLLGLAKIENNEIILNVKLPDDAINLNLALKPLIKEKIKYNRLVSHIVDQIDRKDQLTLRDISDSLRELCPYIVASSNTWDKYSSILLTWIDFADLAIFDKRERTVRPILVDREIKRPNIIIPRRKTGFRTPSIQVSAIEKVAMRLFEAANSNVPFNTQGIKESTLKKALCMLEDLDFIERKTSSIELKQILIDFVNNVDARSIIFSTQAKNFKSYEIIEKLLEEKPDISYDDLCLEFERIINIRLSKQTVKWIVKILLNWARYAGITNNNYSRGRMSHFDKNQQTII